MVPEGTLQDSESVRASTVLPKHILNRHNVAIGASVTWGNKPLYWIEDLLYKGENLSLGVLTDAGLN